MTVCWITKQVGTFTRETVSVRSAPQRLELNCRRRCHVGGRKDLTGAAVSPPGPRQVVAVLHTAVARAQDRCDLALGRPLTSRTAGISDPE